MNSYKKISISNLLRGGFPIGMENTVKVVCKVLCRICNEKRELKLRIVQMPTAPKFSISIAKFSIKTLTFAARIKKLIKLNY